MGRPAAIEADFAAIKFVQGRKVAQLVMEIPIEAADHALAMLGGVPLPDQSRPVAVARLVEQSEANDPPAQSEGERLAEACRREEAAQNNAVLAAARSPESEQADEYHEAVAASINQAWADAGKRTSTHRGPMTNAQVAGMLCHDKVFQNFLANVYGLDFGMPRPDEQAKLLIYELCNVTSRTELGDGDAAIAWHQIKSDFENWKRCAV